MDIKEYQKLAMRTNDEFYKTLTPAFRNEINASIDSNIAELKTCKSNALVDMQISAQMALKNVINAIPDGFPIPLERRK